MNDPMVVQGGPLYMVRDGGVDNDGNCQNYQHCQNAGIERSL